MPDIFTKKKRSEVMSRIRSKGTKIELRMKQVLEENDIKFEYQPKIFGKPDFLIPPNIVVFCDSAFWHGRNWRKLKSKLRKEYWREHIKRNRKRDRIVNSRLKKEGYIVLRFWNDQIEKEINACITTVKDACSLNCRRQFSDNCETRSGSIDRRTKHIFKNTIPKTG